MLARGGFSGKDVVIRDQWMEELKIDPRICLVQLDEMEEACQLAARSFAGSASSPPELSIDWALGPSLRNGVDHSEPLPADAPWEKRQKINRRIGNIMEAKGDLVLGVRDPDTGKLIAVTFVATPKPVSSGKGFIGEFAEFLNYAWLLGPGILLELPVSTFRRMIHLSDILEAAKKKACGPEVPNYYVLQLACDPDHQGKGAGSALLNAVSALADRDQVPCLLETSGRKNINFYGKKGYKTTAFFESLVVPHIPCFERIEPSRIDGGTAVMVRSPQS